ncbi:MAG: transglycosylase domain-containing protein [Lentisphaeria bacterium]|nr:transglycosylase domain-containing protein [Lentisphaeria bacterium]
MKNFRPHRFRLVPAVLAFPLLAGWAVWIVSPYCVGDPMSELVRQTPVRTWTDRNGRVLWHERTYDSQWRLPVPLDRVSPHAVRVILAAEDASFYRHSGVDCAAVCRAAWQNLVSARRISGASTISMQLAGMALPPGRHDFRRKFLQAALARKMEMCHSKKEILEEYLNRIPFGGKICGIEAAAQYYFGLPAEKLDLAEATLLCGLPQRPNFFRPDRHPVRAKERQRIVLKLLTRRGKLTPDEAGRILHREPLRLRDFRCHAPFESAASPGEFRHAFASSEVKGGRTTLDRELHFAVLALLREQRARLRDVRDFAALLVDNRSGEVLVYIGTPDITAKPDGQVDSVRAVRSAGSALKPFIYAEAIAGGLIVGATKISDSPVRYGSYAPGNYDGRFYGDVSAAFALAYSLNTPAVRLTARLGEKRVSETFGRIGLAPRRSGKNMSPGLSLALGTGGYTLWDITRAYAILARGGKAVRLKLTPDGGNESAARQCFPPGVCLMVSSMLRERPFGHSGLSVAWKTGTSNNNCDAWCFACTPDHTLGVWFGNKDGRRSPDLVGASAALPAACEIFELLYRNRTPPRWPEAGKVLEERLLCAESGLTPGAFCRRRSGAFAVPGLPLAPCTLCARETRPPLEILSPAAKQYRTRPGERSVRLPLRTNGGKVLWFLNDRPVGEDLAEYEFPPNTRCTLRALERTKDAESPPRSAEVTFSVVSG